MNDDDIGQLFDPDDVPPRSPDYWERITAQLVAVDNEQANTVVPIRPGMADHPDPKNTDTADHLQRLPRMQINYDSSTRNRRSWYLAAAAVIVVALGVGAVAAVRAGQPSTSGVATDGPLPTDSTGTSETTVPPTTTEPASDAPDSDSTDTTNTTTPDDPDTTEPGSADTSSGSEALINQAEPDLRFDYGFVVRSDVVDGRTWIWFDRSGFGPDQLSGPDFDSEPRWAGSTDFHGGLNVNPTLRTYPLAADADVLVLDAEMFSAYCGFEADAELQWNPSDLDALASVAFNDGSLVSLTFNADNEVSLIRDQRNC